MGAVFLLAAMLMFGSAHGFIPRSLRNAGAPIAVGVLLVVFLIWRFGPDLSSNFPSTVEWAFPTSQPPSAEPSQAARPSPAAGPSQAASSPAKSAPASVKTIVIHEVAPARTQPAPAAEALVAPKPVEEKPVEEKPIAVKPTEVAEAKPTVESSGSSPYDSGVKRAVKSVGRFLHIGGKKEQPAQ